MKQVFHWIDALNLKNDNGIREISITKIYHIEMSITG